MQHGEAKDLAKLSISQWCSPWGLPSLWPSLGSFPPSVMPVLVSRELSRCGVAVGWGTRQLEAHQLLVGLGILENFVSVQRTVRTFENFAISIMQQKGCGWSQVLMKCLCKVSLIIRHVLLGLCGVVLCWWWWGLCCWWRWLQVWVHPLTDFP